MAVFVDICQREGERAGHLRFVCSAGGGGGGAGKESTKIALKGGLQMRERPVL